MFSIRSVRVTGDPMKLRQRAQDGVHPERSALRELAEAKAAAKTLIVNAAASEQADRAAAFTRLALETYATCRHPKLQLFAFKAVRNQPDPRSAALATELGVLASKLDLTSALHQLTSLYPGLLPTQYRSEFGAFYTPPCLTQRLLDLASEHGTNWKSARVLDPAAGAGAFLVAAALRMRSALDGAEPAFVIRSISTRLLGFELDRNAAELAQASLELALADLILASGKRLPAMLRVCDTLDEPPSPTFDVVVGNPPYGRVSLSSEQRVRFSRSLYGHANLYGVFTDIALRWTKPQGLVAYLTPASFMAGHYYMALRRLLAKEAPPQAIEMVHARAGVFEDVLQETVLALYKKGSPKTRAQIRYIHVENVAKATVSTNGQIRLPADPTKPWLAPREAKHSALISHAEQMSTRLRNWGYEVSTGPLVWNRFKSQLQYSPGLRRYPLIWAESVWANGQFAHRATKRNHAPFFEVKRGNEWLLVDSGCVLLQRTTAKEQQRRLIAAEMSDDFVAQHGAVVVENHLNMVRPTGAPSVSFAALAAVLNSSVVDQLFRCMSGSVAVSAFELEALPLPTAKQMQGIEQLLDVGAERSQIDAAISKLYGHEDS